MEIATTINHILSLCYKWDFCCNGYHLYSSFRSTSDVLKVRLQMQLVGQKGPLTGMGRIFTQILNKEGFSALYLGLTPALTRSVLYGGLRLGLYEPSKFVCEMAFGSTNILLKIVAGGFAGSFATALTNPAEVLKVRLQMNAGTKGGAIDQMRKIASEEGLDKMDIS